MFQFVWHPERRSLHQQTSFAWLIVRCQASPGLLINVGLFSAQYYFLKQILATSATPYRCSQKWILVKLLNNTWLMLLIKISLRQSIFGAQDAFSMRY